MNQIHNTDFFFAYYVNKHLMLLKYLESCPLSICVASQIHGTLHEIKSS